MTDEEIEKAYEQLQARKAEKERQKWQADKLKFASDNLGKPVIFETKVTELWSDYDENDDRSRHITDLDRFIDKLPTQAKIKVTIEVVEP